MSPSVSYHHNHKGLLNGPGQNNCFLNSAVQVLWHLDIFRRSFRELCGHACMAEACIFCALKELFGQLQFSHERALPPDALRKALAQSFSDQHRFQLGFMDDAAECFENILLRIHYHIANMEAEDMCNAKHCIPHQKFAMTLVEQSVCSACNATSEPLPFTQMVHYVSASALISQAKHIGVLGQHDLFGQLLKNAGGMGDIRDCPSSCGAKIQIRRTLMNRPEIVSVGIVWDSDRPSLEHIMSLLDTLRTHLRLSDIFHGTFESATYDENVYHELVGVVTYYGKHYSTFFFHTKLRVWVYFDDANVREVGPHWEQVVEKCRRGRYQPLLLLFAVPNGSPIDARNAPKNITAVSKSAVNTFNGAHEITSKISSQRSLSPANSLVLGGRRSLTPNPEKPRNDDDLNQRRAMTPSPEQSPVNPMKKSTLPNNDYQNLLHFQEVVFNGRSNNVEDDSNSDLHDDMVNRYKTEPPIRKPVSRRDSGNWSGDRNSASSSSSTSLENPYHYIIGKMQMRNYGGIPRSPNSIKSGDMSNGANVHSTDLGYDSYSLSSTDSLPLQHSLKHNLQLAQIPEGHQTPAMRTHFNTDLSSTTRMDDCEKLCAEADQLLDRCEQADDLVTAISLCNAATNKARAAMDAPYSNPQTASFARMKHNACVMRARSLHKKLEDQSGCKYNEGRHSREGSNCSARNSSSSNGISHSRQSSKDKSVGGNSHSRQNSQELLTNLPVATAVAGNASVQKKISSDSHFADEKRTTSAKSSSIEIYATLPKNKKGFLSKALLQSSGASKSKNVVEDEEYLMYERPGRSLTTTTSRSKAASNKKDEKRTRSEDRNTKNVGKENSPSNSKDSPSGRKQQPQTAGKVEEKQQEEKQKKQHKIRRKLLMGGLIRRKNRSMPDLREDETTLKDPVKEPMMPFKASSKDDTVLNKKDASVTGNGLNGYLSEGNLQCAGNPNLERSKLMRKSFYGSKIFQFNKVPPPPPLRTTSQLSKTEATTNGGRSQEPPLSLPFMPRDYREMKVADAASDSVTYANGGIMLQQRQQQQAQLQQSSPSMNTVITEAQVHQEDSFQSLPPTLNSGDAVQDFPSLMHHINKAVDDIEFTLPPYPSPAASAAHSRQASEEFPPPPPLIGLMTVAANAELDYYRESRDGASTSGGETWLRELQAKQAARRGKANAIEVAAAGHDDDQAKSSVRDLKSKFESRFNLGNEASLATIAKSTPNDDSAVYPAKSSIASCEQQQRKSSLSSCSSQPDLKQAAFDNKEFKRKSVKKKSVTFCEQVVLVATADDREVDNYIPNPIFERVLRSVLHKESKESGPPQTDGKPVQSVVPLKRTESFQLSQNMPLKPFSSQSNGKENSATHKSIVKTFPSPLPNRSLTIAAKNTKSINRESVDTVDCSSTVQFDGNGNFTVPARNSPQQVSHYSSQPSQNSSQISSPYNNNNYNNHNHNSAIVSNPPTELSMPESNINETVNGNYHQTNESNCRYNVQMNDYDSRGTSTSNEPKVSFINGSVGFSPSSTLNRRLNNYSNFDTHYNNHGNSNNNNNNNNNSCGSGNSVSSIADAQNSLQTCQPNYVSSAMAEHQINYAHQNSYQPMSLQPYHHSSPNSSLPSTHHDLNTRIPTRSSPSANYQTNGSHLPIATAAVHRTNGVHHNGATGYGQCPSGSHQNYNSSANSYHQNNTGQLLSHNSYSGQNPSQQATHYQPSPLPSRQFTVQYGGKYADARRAPINNLAVSQNGADLQHQRLNNSYKSVPNSSPPQNTAQTLDRTTIGYGQCPQQNSAVNSQTDSTEFRSNASPSHSSGNVLHYPKSNSYAHSYHSESSPPYQSMPNPSSLQTTNYHHPSVHATKPVKSYQQSQQPLAYPQFHSATASAQHSPTQNYHFSLQGQNAHHAYNSNQNTDSPAQFNSLTKHSSSQYYPVYNSAQHHQSAPVAQQHNYNLQQMHQPPSPSYNSASAPSVKNTQPLPPPVYQHPPIPPTNSKQNPGLYQRVPTPNCSQQMMSTPSGENMKYSPYQHPPMPKHADYYSSKSPGERVNSTIACSLCKKKQILPPAVYCADCEYYMSRFKQQKT